MAPAPVYEDAERIAAALLARKFTEAEEIWAAAGKLKRWESLALAEIVWQKLGEEAAVIRDEWAAKVPRP